MWDMHWDCHKQLCFVYTTGRQHSFAQAANPFKCTYTESQIFSQHTYTCMGGLWDSRSVSGSCLLMVVVWVRKTIIVTVLEDTNMWCNIPHSLKNITLQLHSTAYCSGHMVDIVSRCILTCRCANTWCPSISYCDISHHIKQWHKLLLLFTWTSSRALPVQKYSRSTHL